MVKKATAFVSDADETVVSMNAHRDTYVETTAGMPPGSQEGNRQDGRQDGRQGGQEPGTPQPGASQPGMVFSLDEGTAPEQAVIAHFRLSGEGFGEAAERRLVFEAERAMAAEVATAGVGEVDGDEFGGGQVAIFAYGPDAHALFAVMEPTLRELPFRPAHAVLREGSAGDAEARESRVEF